MSCKKSTLKKYRERASPPYPAQDCRGKRKKGSDGIWYASVIDKAGVYRWKKEGRTGRTGRSGRSGKTVKRGKTGKTGKTKKMVGVRTYLIHDNGSRPYRVEVGSSNVVVYPTDVSVPVYQDDIEKVWVGDNLLSLAQYAPRGTGKGNTILVQTAPHRYTYIGHTIYSFDTGADEILEYYSPIGNNDVPYPYAVGRDNVYFLLDKKRVPVEHLDVTKDGYTQFYQEIPAGKKTGFRVRMI